MAQPKPPFHAMPDALAGRMLDLGLGLDHVGLNALAWAESSRHLLDGRLACTRARALRGWGPKRQADLVDKAIWQVEGDDIILVDYLEVNRSRVEVEIMREAKAKGGHARAERAERGDRGTFTGKDPGRCPIHDKAWKRGKYSPWLCPTKVSENTSRTHPRMVFGWCQEVPSQAWMDQQMLDVQLVPTETTTSTDVVVRTDEPSADAAGSPENSSGRWVREVDDEGHQYDDIAAKACVVCDRRVRPDGADRVVRQAPASDPSQRIYGLVHEGWCLDTFLAAA